MHLCRPIFEVLSPKLKDREPSFKDANGRCIFATLSFKIGVRRRKIEAVTLKMQSERCIFATVSLKIEVGRLKAIALALKMPAKDESLQPGLLS